MALTPIPLKWLLNPIPYAGVHKTGICGIQDTTQIVNGKTNGIENNNKYQPSGEGGAR